MLRSVIAMALLLPAIASAQLKDGVWQPIPLISAELRAQGFKGGEGGQWPRGLAFDSTGNVAILSIDVGGIYRSRDAGNSWHPVNIGYLARGSACASFDPGNPQRVLSIGANSQGNRANGIYLSENQADSWTHVKSVEISGLDEVREQIAWDVTTFDPVTRRTNVVFWSRISEDNPGWGTVEQKPIVYKSIDGGKTWNEIPGTQAQGGATLRSHPVKGTLYAANGNGFFRSVNQGTTFTKTLSEALTGVDVSKDRPNFVWATSKDKFWISSDEGQTWTSRELGVAYRPDGIAKNIKVSPADANKMVLWSDQDPNQWNYPRYFSSNGGQTWEQSNLDGKGAFLPMNARQGIFAWHATNPNVLLSIGGDWPTKSVDGGRNYRYSGTGNNAVLVGANFSFSASDPNVVYIGSQDYNGAITANAGHTWTYTNVSGLGWGGFTYGGYALNRNVMVVGNSDGWEGKRFLHVSKDGGATWTNTNKEYGNFQIANGDPKRPNVIFAGEWRSNDSGTTWAKMNGCQGVFTHSAGADKALFGVNQLSATELSIVRSADGGVTWREITRTTKGIYDLAWDHRLNRLYVAADMRAWTVEKGVWKILETIPDVYGAHWVKTVAIDPVDPKVVYVGNNGNIYAPNNSVQRSVNSGGSWKLLTLQAPKAGHLDGGRETFWIRVHPKSREVWCATSCYGIWKVGPPAAVAK